MAMLSTILSSVPFVVMLGVVFLVHKGGHYGLGRAFGHVDGRYQDLDFSFGHTSVWSRFVIVLAGPAANFLVAVVVFWGLLAFGGGSAFPHMATSVGQVIVSSPAARGGIRAGDRIVAVNGKPVRTWEELARAIPHQAGRMIQLTAERGGEGFEVILTTRASTQQDVIEGALGIISTPGFGTNRLHPLAALTTAAKLTAGIAVMILLTLGKIMIGFASPKAIGGAVLWSQMTGLQMQLESLMRLIFLTGHLSVILGVLSLLPLPFLDGGRFCFLVIELVRGRPLSLEVQQRVQWLGVLLLLLLAIFGVYLAYDDQITGWLKTL